MSRLQRINRSGSHEIFFSFSAETGRTISLIHPLVDSSQHLISFFSDNHSAGDHTSN
jgi:hypothetical protein